MSSRKKKPETPEVNKTKVRIEIVIDDIEFDNIDWNSVMDEIVDAFTECGLFNGNHFHYDIFEEVD